MRILRVIPSIDPRSGGPAEAARRFDTELIRLGHPVEVVSLDHPSPALAAGYPAPVHALGHRREGYRHSPALVPWLQRNAARFDAVLVDGLWQYHGLGTRRALAATGLPYFVFTHGMLDPWFKRAYPLKHLKKWLYWPWGEYRVLRDARAVIFTCEEERRLARQSFWLYRAREAVTAFGTADVPQDAAAPRAHFLARFPALHGQRIALFLGRIQEKKGCDLLIEAFARVAARDARLRLVLAGPQDPAWTARLKTLADARGIAERLCWTGMLLGDDKWGAFHAAEVFCLPSHQENFGIAVAEALACGKPVMVSDKVNIWREIVADGAGWVETDTIDGTRRALERWLATPPDAMHAMGQAARRCFVQRFRVDQAARTLVGILAGGVHPPATPDAAAHSAQPASP